MTQIKLCLMGFGNSIRAFVEILSLQYCKVLEITTDYMGKISIVEHDPMLMQTGYGLFSDLIRVLNYL